MFYESFTPVSPYRVRLLIFVDAQPVHKATYPVVGFTRNEDTAAPEMVLMNHQGELLTLSQVEVEEADGFCLESGIPTNKMVHHVNIVDP